MKISDYIVQSLKGLGVRYVFGLQGSGTAVQIFDSLGRIDGIDYVCTLHEQAAGMAADAYANMSEGIGACVVDSGPAATNLYTAIAGSYYNSISVIYIIGQAQTRFLRRDESLRFYGYHENNDIEAMFRPVTKYVSQINDPRTIKGEWEKAIYLACEGRPGPVLIALPDDITWMDVDIDEQRGFIPPHNELTRDMGAVGPCLDRMRSAQRPIILVGSGVRQGKAREELRAFLDLLSWPVAFTWGMRDFLPSSDVRNVGSFGVQGSRAGNLAVQNADFILSIGARLDPSETGGVPGSFARGAYLVSVDIDKAELFKYSSYGIANSLAINADVRAFLSSMNSALENVSAIEACPKWVSQIDEWKRRYPLFSERYWQEDHVNPYVIVQCLSEALSESDIIVTDTATSRNYLFQAFEVKEGQRLITWLNWACLGYGLPAAIGAAFAKPGGRIIAVMGDGALQFNVQELATVVHHRLNVKIVVFDNGGFSSICYAQRRYLEGRFHGSDREHGLPLPDCRAVASAYGIPVFEAVSNSQVRGCIDAALSVEGPALCDIHLPIEHWTTPCRTGSDPIEDMTPKLSREEFLSQMIVDPWNPGEERGRP